jgi:hypothetical protein
MIVAEEPHRRRRTLRRLPVAEIDNERAVLAPAQLQIGVRQGLCRGGMDQRLDGFALGTDAFGRTLYDDLGRVDEALL